jgi:putative transposase
MTSYRRLRLPGATYVFTVCLAERGATTLVEHVDMLRWAYLQTIRDLPVTCHAMVVLPDHLHAVWTEPAGCVAYSERWRRIKARFSHGLDQRPALSPSLRAKRERGIWQRRFWEHAIRNEAEFALALAYCRDNPVQHGLVADAADWPYSSFASRNKARQADPAPAPGGRLPSPPIPPQHAA